MIKEIDSQLSLRSVTNIINENKIAGFREEIVIQVFNYQNKNKKRFVKKQSNLINKRYTY